MIQVGYEAGLTNFVTEAQPDVGRHGVEHHIAATSKCTLYLRLLHYLRIHAISTTLVIFW